MGKERRHTTHRTMERTNTYTQEGGSFVMLGFILRAADLLHQKKKKFRNLLKMAFCPSSNLTETNASQLPESINMGSDDLGVAHSQTLQ